MSFLQDMSRYPDILFPYLSILGIRGHFVRLFFRVRYNVLSKNDATDLQTGGHLFG